MNYMDKSDLEKLSKSQLINMLLKLSVKKPKIIIVDDTKPRKLVPTPRKSVKQIVGEYNNSIIAPPPTPSTTHKQTTTTHQHIQQQPNNHTPTTKNQQET